MKRWMIFTAAIALGTVAGWAWWNWYGCESGCGITGQWWSSAAYGGVMGYLLLGLVLPARRRDPDVAEGDQ